MARCPLSNSLNALILNLLLIAVAMGQANNGSLTGRTVDAGGGILQGARVELQAAGNSAVSDNKGEFTINDLAPGEYILTATYVGLAPFEKKITVTAGQSTRIEA